MKRFKKFTAVILAVIMAASVMCLNISAADEADPYAALKEGTGYVAIGDSFTRGYGAGEDWEDLIYLNDTYGNYNCRNVTESYPNLIAKKFGLYAPDSILNEDGKMWQLAHDALSVSYVNDLLGIEDNYCDDEFTYKYGYMIERYETDLIYFGDENSYAVGGKKLCGKNYKVTVDGVAHPIGEIMTAREMLSKASLISIGLGQCDVVYKAQLFGLNTLDTSSTESTIAGVAHIIELLYKYFDNWKAAYPKLLDFIKEANPDCRVVIVGTLNPLKNATLSDEFAIKIGSVLNVVMDSMNACMQEWALKYGYMFVDISNVETPTCVTPMTIGDVMSLPDTNNEKALVAHPTTKGYKQIADMIIAAVEKDLEKDSMNKLEAFFVSLFDLIKAFFVNFFTRLGIGA